MGMFADAPRGPLLQRDPLERLLAAAVEEIDMIGREGRIGCLAHAEPRLAIHQHVEPPSGAKAPHGSVEQGTPPIRTSLPAIPWQARPARTCPIGLIEG